jgi:hypothetical protein
MTRWTRYRVRYQRKRNALLLLTMSGAIRSADVEVPFLRGKALQWTAKRKKLNRRRHPTSRTSIDLVHGFKTAFRSKHWSANTAAIEGKASSGELRTVYSKQLLRSHYLGR